MNAWVVFLPPLVLLLVSTGVFLGMVWRYRMHAGLIDVDTIPEVKEEKKKDELLRRRIEERGREAQEKRQQKLKEVSTLVMSKLGNYLQAVERKIQRYVRTEERRRRGATALEHSIKTLLEEGEGMLQMGDLVGAEKKLFAVIRKDTKNIRAYKSLADIYMRKKEWQDAKATYEFIHKLSPEDDNTLIALSDLSETLGDVLSAIQYLEQAIIINPNMAQRFSRLCSLFLKINQPAPAFEAISQAVELESGNSEYLDVFVECAILIGDKRAAEEGFQQLRRVDYESQKLDVFRERIERME